MNQTKFVLRKYPTRPYPTPQNSILEKARLTNETDPIEDRTDSLGNAGIHGIEAAVDPESDASTHR